MLEQVERANLFLVELDEVRGWWRYHQLFADLLRARLQQEQPDRVPASAGRRRRRVATTPPAGPLTSSGSWTPSACPRARLIAHAWGAYAAFVAALEAPERVCHPLAINAVHP